MCHHMWYHEHRVLKIKTTKNPKLTLSFLDNELTRTEMSSSRSVRSWCQLSPLWNRNFLSSLPWNTGFLPQPWGFIFPQALCLPGTEWLVFLDNSNKQLASLSRLLSARHPVKCPTDTVPHLASLRERQGMMALCPSTEWSTWPQLLSLCMMGKQEATFSSLSILWPFKPSFSL